MAVDANTYGTVADIQTLIGDLVPGRIFTAATSPSTSDVERNLDRIAAQIHAALAAEGFPIGSGTGLVGALLAAINNYGAAALTMDAVPSLASMPDDLNAPSSRRNAYQKAYDTGIKQFGGQALELLGLARTTPRTARLTAGARLDAAGYVKLPFFSRGMTDIPGSRPLDDPNAAP